MGSLILLNYTGFPLTRVMVTSLSRNRSLQAFTGLDPYDSKKKNVCIPAKKQSVIGRIETTVKPINKKAQRISHYLDVNCREKAALIHDSHQHWNEN